MYAQRFLSLQSNSQQIRSEMTKLGHSSLLSHLPAPPHRLSKDQSRPSVALSYEKERESL